MTDFMQDPDKDPYAELRKEVSKSAGNGSGKLFDLLNQDEKRDVLEFVEWLKTTSMSSASRSSYKTYVTKAMLKKRGVINEDLTNDEKSGVRKFLAWRDSEGLTMNHDEEE